MQLYAWRNTSRCCTLTFFAQLALTWQWCATMTVVTSHINSSFKVSATQHHSYLCTQWSLESPANGLSWPLISITWLAAPKMLLHGLFLVFFPIKPPSGSYHQLTWVDCGVCVCHVSLIWSECKLGARISGRGSSDCLFMLISGVIATYFPIFLISKMRLGHSSKTIWLLAVNFYFWIEVCVLSLLLASWKKCMLHYIQTDLIFFPLQHPKHWLRLQRPLGPIMLLWWYICENLNAKCNSGVHPLELHQKEKCMRGNPCLVFQREEVFSYKKKSEKQTWKRSALKNWGNSSLRVKCLFQRAPLASICLKIPQ